MDVYTHLNFASNDPFKNVLMLDLFHLLSSPDVNWWTGVVWIIVMFLSDSHSDGTHSLQSIHCWDISTNLMKTHTHPDLRWTEGEHIYSTF